MKNILRILIWISPILAFTQVSGFVMDSLTKEPVAYVNVWLKGKPLGGTTNETGKFIIEQAKENDTLVISYLGYEKMEIIAQNGIEILLKERVEELDQILLIPMKKERELEIKTFEKANKIKDFLFSGKGFQYSVAKYIPYHTDYKQTPFLNHFSFVTSNSLKKNVPILINLIKVDENGFPINSFLLKNHLVFCESGVREIVVELSSEKIQIPEKGLFIVLERLFTDENRLLNKNFKKNKDLVEFSYQPAIGMTNEQINSATWWNYGGSWYSISDLKKKFDFVIKDIAINVQMTN